MIQQLTEVDGHCDNDYKGEPRVEHRQEVEYGDDDVDDRRHDAEQDIVEHPADTRCAAVDHSQHLASLTTQMPAQRETVQVRKQTNLHRAAISHINCT